MHDADRRKAPIGRMPGMRRPVQNHLSINFLAQNRVGTADTVFSGGVIVAAFKPYMKFAYGAARLVDDSIVGAETVSRLRSWRK